MSFYIIGCVGFVVLLYGPNEKFKTWLITTAMQTMNHQYYCKWFYSKEEINDIINNNYVEESGESTDTSLIEKVEYKYRKDSYENDVKIEDEENNTYTYDLSAECGKKSCTLTASLTVNPEGDFDKIKGYADELAKENMDENITEDNADYNIELEIGQTVTISGKKLTGYDLSGMDIVEVEDLESKYTFTAKKAGIANGNFYLDEDGEDVRTFYLTVKESKKGNKVEDISLKIK